MAPANKQYTIREFSYFFCKEDGEKSADNCKLDRQTFEEIKKFILENKETGLDETLELLSLTSKSGYGEIIKAQNYVGLIQTKSGAMIEILPKIYKGKNKLGIDECRKQLIRMLSVLKEAPFKRSQSADLDTAAGTLYEIFMHMFMDEFTQLQRKGLRSDYLPVEENLPYLKGKLQLAQHLKHNAAHQERFYVQYDEYLRNRPENRLIKATLLFLAGKATSSLLQQRIRQGLGQCIDARRGDRPGLGCRHRVLSLDVADIVFRDGRRLAPDPREVFVGDQRCGLGHSPDGEQQRDQHGRGADHGTAWEKISSPHSSSFFEKA